MKSRLETVVFDIKEIDGDEFFGWFHQNRWPEKDISIKNNESKHLQFLFNSKKYLSDGISDTKIGVEEIRSPQGTHCVVKIEGKLFESYSWPPPNLLTNLWSKEVERELSFKLQKSRKTRARLFDSDWQLICSLLFL